MWSALENAALRESLPSPLRGGDAIHDILIAGQLNRGRYNLHHLGRRRSIPYLLKQFYSINTDAFLRWQNEARYIDLPQTTGFVWPCEEWRGGLISPFPDGVPLEDWLATEQPLTARLNVAAQLANRIARLHRSGIQHRNLSPSSIWIGDETLSIADFSSSRCEQWDDLWADSVLTVGDTDYASPELLQGENCEQAHDVYAFGTLLHLLLAGKTAFGALKQLLRHIAPGSVHPDQLPASADLPTRIRNLAADCLAIDPPDRPTSDEAASVLEQYNLHEHDPDDTLEIPHTETTQNGRQRVIVFIKDDSRAVPLFDAAIQTATDTPSLFLFVSLIPGNLPSGHLERFKGNLFRKLGQGLQRCRSAGLDWSLRVLDSADPEATASTLTRRYAPDAIFLGGSTQSGSRRHSFNRKLSATGIRINRIT